MSTAPIRDYWTRIVASGCVICGGPAEIAHCHGGSIRELGYVKAKGKKLDYMDWLVLPLCPGHHRLTTYSLDINPRAWEEAHGTQVEHINALVARTGVNVWELAKSRHERMFA
jgi:hypothetical protein